MTFGYNLARLNLDRRHPDAGYRYAEQRGERAVLRAEFTPTTEFCPQSDTLVRGSFRAWNGLSERHDYDQVRVRVRADGHHASDEINAEARDLEATLRNSETVPDTDSESGRPDPVSDDGAGDRGPRSPF